MTATPLLDLAAALRSADALWESSAIPALAEYIAIPALSPAFDADWERRGELRRAAAGIAEWARRNGPPGLAVELLEEPKRTPLLWLELPGNGEGTVLLYGHCDKQPEMSGWGEVAEGRLGPWSPLRAEHPRHGDVLYGRGGGDDGYAAFAAVTALRLLHEQAAARPRCVVLIEASEESGSPDLEGWLERLGERIGTPALVLCLDSGADDYGRLWLTDSLRGMVKVTVEAAVLREGIHSGSGSGLVASSFRVLRRLLDRLEDPVTGEALLPELRVAIPPERQEQARRIAALPGPGVAGRLPLLPGVRPVSDEPAELILNNTWRATLSVIGIDGIPACAAAGNVLRPATTARLSIRLPPTADPQRALAAVTAALTADPPEGARITVSDPEASAGWCAPPLAPWLEAALERSSAALFGAPPLARGEGGSIPFMNLLGERYPAAQFLVTGVLGPDANAHGPNEFLHLPLAKRLAVGVAEAIAAMAGER